MEGIGHKLMAFRIDEQFLAIVQSQITQALEKLGVVGMKVEGQAAVEILYYLLSLGLPAAEMGLSGTPGMQAVGLVIEPFVPTGTWPGHWVNAVMVVSFLSIKWSMIKLQELSSIERWANYPQVIDEIIAVLVLWHAAH